MSIRMPSLAAEQIQQWMQEGADKLRPDPLQDAIRTVATASSHHPGFDFKKARQALQRARAKTSLRMLKPLRRIRTDQAAVNESLTDAVSALLTVNKAMASELSALSAEIAELRLQLSQRTSNGKR